MKLYTEYDYDINRQYNMLKFIIRKHVCVHVYIERESFFVEDILTLTK